MLLHKKSIKLTFRSDKVLNFVVTIFLWNLISLLALESFSVDVSKTCNISTNHEMLNNGSSKLSPCNKFNESSSECFSEKEAQFNNATIRNNRYEKFVSSNAINLSSRHLSLDEVSLFSKRLKFVSTPKHINKAKIKEEIEICGRKLRLLWHFRNDPSESDINPFQKSPNLTLKETLPYKCT